MSYQFFGENENIFGYKDLQVKIYYSCARLNIYLGIKYSSVLTKEQSDGVGPDDVLKLIKDKYETNVQTNLLEFSSSLLKESSFVPYGTIANDFTLECRPQNGDITAVKRTFQIFQTNTTFPGFTAYHQRMQTFLMWFIEEAVYIDIDDEKWNFFVLYETLSPSSGGALNGNRQSGQCQYCFVGYASVYNYYAYPSNVRPRISQFFILPPFQRIGLGSRLLETIYTHYNNKLTVDICVEDPSDYFQRMRDVVDSRLCSRLPAFQPEQLHQGWSKAMADQAKEVHKISPKQARRVYEILRLKATNRADADQYRAYRLNIKQRFNSLYEKQIQDLEKIKKRGLITDTKYASLLKTTQVPKDYRITTLTKQYEELEKEYLEIIAKLA